MCPLDDDGAIWPIPAEWPKESAAAGKKRPSHAGGRAIMALRGVISDPRTWSGVHGNTRSYLLDNGYVTVRGKSPALTAKARALLKDLDSGNRFVSERSLGQSLAKAAKADAIMDKLARPVQSNARTLNALQRAMGLAVTDATQARATAMMEEWDKAKAEMAAATPASRKRKR